MSYDINEPWEPGRRRGGPRVRHHHPSPGRRGGRRGDQNFGGHHRHGPRHGLHSGRKLSSSDLQLIILSLLEKSASHGYELIKSLEEMSDGFYVPSPGMIYPSLTYLEEIGYAAVQAEGTKKHYHLTEAGMEHLVANRAHVDGILGELVQIGARMEEARRALAGQERSEGEFPGQSEELRKLRDELKTFMRGFSPLDSSDEDRTTVILREALSKLRNDAIQPETNKLSPDQLLAIVSERRSMGLSRLSGNAVDRKIIESMLEAANWAPSHEDTEPWRFTVFMGDGREKLARLFEAAQREKLGAAMSDADIEGVRKRAFAAPVWISIGMSPKLREDGTLLMSVEEELMAVACAVQNLHLMAQSHGLAGMWHSKGLSVNPVVARGLGLEPPSRLLGLFMCGWPAGQWLTSTRGPISDKVSWVDAL